DGSLVKMLFEEKNDKYVEPEKPLYFLSNDPSKFVWFSERDGWNHLYLYNTDGELLKQLTSGDWVVTEFLGVDRKGEDFFIVGTKESPIERHLYKINFIDYKNPKKLTADLGTHAILKHNSTKFFIDKFSSLTVPNKITIFDDLGNGIGLIHNSENPIENYAVGAIDIFTIKADDDSTDLYCRMVYPSNFDTAKTYPVIVYVYGGPHNQLVLNKWDYSKYAFWFKYMAQNDYIVFTVDNRGTSNRGLDFEQATFRNLGTVEIADQLKGIEYLKKQPFVNSNRIGVYGWSYGGFMTTSLMTRTDNVFKVGVAGGAVIDWNYYEVMYTERYMDTPQTNFEGYSKANLLNYITNLKGKLLHVHGTLDPVVVWQQTLQYAKKAAENNIPLDYYPYLGHEHHVLDKDKLHLYNKISNYFLDNL
ncbi:MAG: prolyl oligopeptidase family serine peptidase, partial [Bacteroidota bacterium]